MGLFSIVTDVTDALGITDSKAPMRAANAQIASADRANEIQLDMFNQTREDQQPWRNAGGMALRDLMYGFGHEMPVIDVTPTSVERSTPRAGGGTTLKELAMRESGMISPGGSKTAQPAATTMVRLPDGTLTSSEQMIKDAVAKGIVRDTRGKGVFGSLGPGSAGSKAYKEWEQQYLDVSNRERGVGKYIRSSPAERGLVSTADQVKAQVQPAQIKAKPTKAPPPSIAKDYFSQDFSEADGAFKGHSGRFSMADYEADPGYAFRLAEGQKAIERSAAARGGIRGGGTLKALTRYGQGVASDEYGRAYDRFNQDYGNAYNRFNNDRTTRFNRLSSLAGVGQTANNTIANAGSNYANQAGANITGAGNAQAAGIIGQANTMKDLINMGIQGAAMYYGAGGGR